MKMILILILVLCPTFSLAKTHHLGIGESLVLPTDDANQSLRIQKKGLLSILDEGRQIVLNAKKLGETNVTLGSQSHHVKILHKNKFDSLKALKTWLSNKRGPKIEVIDGTPVVTGRLLRLSDFQDLRNHMSEKSIYLLATKVTPSMRHQLAAHLALILKKHHLPAGELVTSPRWQYIVGRQSKKQISQYKKLLSPFGIGTAIDAKSLADKRVIQIKVIIAHIKKTFLRQWGVQWPSEFGASLMPGSPLQWQQLTMTLKALEASGDGQMLATPTLITESQNTAEFHSGGEFPVRTTTQFNNNVQWKRYGLFLKTTPTSNSQDHLHIEVDLEFSALDQNNANEGVPALTRSQVKTQINMKKPKPFVLSGFLQQSAHTSRSGLPWLQQIPILAPLFSTGHIYRDDYELVFIMVPRFHEQ